MFAANMFQDYARQKNWAVESLRKPEHEKIQAGVKKQGENKKRE